MRTLGSALVTVALTLTLGGCNVTGGGKRSDERAAIEEVVGDGELTIDLSAPPSREDVALPQGRKTVILEREGRKPYDLTMIFADRSRLESSVEWVSLTAEDADSAPTMLVARRAGDDLDVVRAAVEEGVRDVGVDASRTAGVLDQVAEALTGQADVIVSLPTRTEAPEPVRHDALRVREGAGEFGDALADGVAAFELSWQSAFDATSETSGNIAANVGGFTLDLEALDLGNS